MCLKTKIYLGGSGGGRDRIKPTPEYPKPDTDRWAAITELEEKNQQWV